jgi:spore germination protein YaaH
MLTVRVGEIDMLVETVVVAGSQQTSKLGDAIGQLSDAFERAQEAIVEVAASTARMIGRTAARGVRPDHVEVQFGLLISAQGGIILAKAGGQASLTVTLTYDAHASAAEPVPVAVEAGVAPVVEPVAGEGE